MAKSSSRRARAAAPPPLAITPRLSLDWPLLLIAVLGCAVTGILIWSATTAAALPYCAAGSACDVVQSSAWSQFLGMPLALWGLMTYLALGLVALAARTPARRARWTALLATAGFVFSLYLTFIALVVIKATCAYCLASLALLTAAFAWSLRAQGVTVRAWRATGAVIALLAAAVLHFDAQGIFDPARGPVDPYLRALAMHLDQRGAKFYGAYWCPHCQQQKALFGPAARYLPYVECSPHGQQAPRATICETENIKSYPTWIIDGRRIERELMPSTLATMSGFRQREPAAAVVR